jgi:TetR/AcrR family transcriptional regulator, lmrAB and yxaGH operons repressor
MTQADVRTNMVKGAVALLATKGLEGTSFSEVLAKSGAPRGSIYHHFPGGKSELLHSALDLVSAQGLGAMEATRGRPAVEVVEKFLSLWRQLLDVAQLRAGCGVLAVTVADSPVDLVEHAGSIFREWTDQLDELLVAGGVNAITARALATTIIAATEGAVVLCRAEANREPFDLVSDTLVRLVSDAATTSAGKTGV